MCLLTYLCITCANTVNLATITLYYGVCVRLYIFVLPAHLLTSAFYRILVLGLADKTLRFRHQ